MKLDMHHIETLLDHIRQGMNKDIACDASGIGRSTYYEWVNQGKEDAKEEKESLQQQLVAGLLKAEADFELHHLKMITKAATDDWHASAWCLERTRPSRYARRQAEPGPKGGDRIIEIG